MHSDDRDDDALIEALRGAWQGSVPPSPSRALGEEDPLTQRAVAWTRAAWLALPVPAARAPVAPISVLPRRRGRAVAAAAALLVAVGLAWLVAVSRRESAPQLDGPVATEAPAPPEPPALPEPPAPTIVAVDDHRIELRSGPVRLYLITESHPEDPR